MAPPGVLEKTGLQDGWAGWWRENPDITWMLCRKGAAPARPGFFGNKTRGNRGHQEASEATAVQPARALSCPTHLRPSQVLPVLPVHYGVHIDWLWLTDGTGRRGRALRRFLDHQFRPMDWSPCESSPVTERCPRASTGDISVMLSSKCPLCYG